MSSPAWVPMGLDAFTERAFWPLDEASGTAIRDASGFDHVGTLQGGVIWGVDGPKPGSKAIQFDGTNGMMTAAAAAPLTAILNAWTLAAWIYPTALRASACGIIGKDAITGRITFGLGMGSNGQMSAPNRIWGGNYIDGWRGAVDTQDAVINAWAHYAITWDGGTFRLYRNGAQVSTAAASAFGDSYAGTVYVAGAFPTITGYFPGRIADARIFNRALPAAEVLALYNGPVGALMDAAWVPTN